jgi:hypothetical protein
MLLLLAKSTLAGLSVSVSATGWVRGTEIELGELCRLGGADRALVERARVLSLGYAPAPGFSRLVTLARIRDELSRAFPGCAIEITGEGHCLARPEVEELLPAMIEAAARDELQQAFEGIQASFTLAEPLQALTIPRGQGPSTLRATVASGKRTSGTLGVSLEVSVDGRPYRTIWTKWRIDVWETRPAAVPRPSSIFALLWPSAAAPVEITRALRRDDLPHASESGG